MNLVRDIGLDTDHPLALEHLPGPIEDYLTCIDLCEVTDVYVEYFLFRYIRERWWEL